MRRRGLAMMVLAVLALQVAGGIMFSPICLEPCPDDAEGTSCPPVCSLCTGCTHAQAGIAIRAASAAPPSAAEDLLPLPIAVASPGLCADIFHVPLRS